MPSQEGSEVFDNLIVGQTTKFLDEVLFAVTIYRLRVIDSKAWISLENALAPFGQIALLFVYDNSPIAQELPRSPLLTPQYEHDANNPGISAAFNAAYRFAKGRGKRWLLLLDQDTLVNALAIAQYAAAVKAYPSHSLFAPIVVDSKGMLSPFRFRYGRGFRVSRLATAFLPLQEFRAINAGLLVSSDLFRRTGGYEEAIVLDFSDIAFLEKVKPICDSLGLVDAIIEQDFSGSNASNCSADLERFKRYSEGALQFSRCFGHPLEIRWGTFLRAMKLTFQWRSLEFLRIHFKAWKT